MKDKKNIISVCLLLLVVTVLGISYAWFNAKIENLNTKISTVTTGSLKIKYVDGEEISLSNMIPGNYVTKEFSVSNVGDEAVSFSLELETIENTVLKNELVISASCTRLNGDVIEGTCNNINEKSVSSSFLSRNITIEPNITYKYEIKLLFKDTNRNQNYNMSAKYNGKINVREYTQTDGIYCTYNGEITQGAEYVNGQYTYRYKQVYLPDYNSKTESYIWTDMEEDGWGVILSDKESTDPVTSELCTYINDKPVSAMSFMFVNSKASSIDFSSFDTSNVTYMDGMFFYSNVTTLDLSNFDTSNVTDMSYMFTGSRATTLDLSNFDTSNVIYMNGMFSGSQAATLDVSNFDTSKVINMYAMFAGSKASILDLSNFDTSNVTNMGYMFCDSTNLKTIYSSSKFVTNKVTNSTNMFASDSNLVGGAGTTYNASYVDKIYARIDGGTGSPGYFTLK